MNLRKTYYEEFYMIINFMSYKFLYIYMAFDIGITQKFPVMGYVFFNKISNMLNILQFFLYITR